MAYQPPLPDFGDQRFGFVPGKRPRLLRGGRVRALGAGHRGPGRWDDVSQRRDYDLRHPAAPTHSPGDPPPEEDLEPRARLPIGEWVRRGKETA